MFLRKVAYVLLVGSVLSQLHGPRLLASKSDSVCLRAGATRVTQGVRFECRRMAGKLKWVKVLGSPGRSSSSTTVQTSIVPALPVVALRTLSNGTRNTSFQIALQEMPELAQSIVLDSPLTFDMLTTAIYGVNTVKPEFFSVPFSEKSKYEESKFSFDAFDATISVAIWKAQSADLLADSRDDIDVSLGFDLVYSASVQTTITQNQYVAAQAPMNLQIPLSRTVDLSPGSYLVILGFEWRRLDILTIRLWGQESGNNTKGGKSGEAVKNCTYMPTIDAYPVGKAYMGLGSRRWNGDAASSVGFGTRFRPATAKVTSCIVKGEWGNDIFNPGDLDLAFVKTK